MTNTGPAATTGPRSAIREHAPKDEVPAAEFPVGSPRDYAARTAVLALTAPQRLALADVARGGDIPGMGMHAARRSVLEAKGLATSQRVGTGRGAWTRVDLTDLGRDGLAVLADAEGGEFAVAHAVMVGQELDASRRADDDVQAAERDDEDATDAPAAAPRVDDEDLDEDATDAQRDAEPAPVVWCDTHDHPATGHTRRATCLRPTDTPDDGPTVDEVEPEPMTVDEALAELGHHHELNQRDKEVLVRARLTELEAQVASLTARLERNQHDYARARRRITELEDAPVRKHARRLVEALRYDRLDMPRVKALTGLLADALGVDTRPGCPHGGTYSSDCPECARLRRDARERPPTPEAHPAIGDDPRRALEALGIKVRPGLPGERIEVREVERVSGWPRTRVLGFLTDGVFRTDEGRGAREIPAALVAAYVDAVRELGFPARTARRVALGYVLDAAGRSAPGLGAR